MRTHLWLATVCLCALPLLASAKAPSAGCRDGAQQCHDAWDKLEKCEQGNPDKKDACTAERGEADAACKESSKACHTDGSRRASK